MKRIYLILVIFLLLTSCQPSPSTRVKTEVFSLETTSKLTVTGTFYPRGKMLVLLANQEKNDTEVWQPLVESLLKEEGFSVATFTYTSSTEENALRETRMVYDYMVNEKNFDSIICMGGSIGASACGNLAHEACLKGVALISGFEPVSPYEDLDIPKLFVAGEQDVIAAEAMTRAYETANVPKTLQIYKENSAHATDIFATSDGQALIDLLFDFAVELLSDR